MNKKKVISFRVTEEEAQTLQRTAKQKKMSRSSLIAQCCLHPSTDLQTSQSNLILKNTLRKQYEKYKKECIDLNQFEKILEVLLNENDNKNH
ncbi:MAG: hypothetical protein J1E01_03660 [Acetatifactor sp.]|nr:hypothetical protein [Acetatifactor sp.]